MYLPLIMTKCRLLAVALLLAGSSLDAGSHPLSWHDSQMPLTAAALCPQVSSAEVPLSLQLYRSRSEQSPPTQVCSDELGILYRHSSVLGVNQPCGLEGWHPAAIRPLCEQALHQRTGVFLS